MSLQATCDDLLIELATFLKAGGQIQELFIVNGQIGDKAKFTSFLQVLDGSALQVLNLNNCSIRCAEPLEQA
jgi:hypothetical protein